jgi:hypothetical protein
MPLRPVDQGRAGVLRPSGHHQLAAERPAVRMHEPAVPRPGDPDADGGDRCGRDEVSH